MDFGAPQTLSFSRSLTPQSRSLPRSTCSSGSSKDSQSIQRTEPDRARRAGGRGRAGLPSFLPSLARSAHSEINFTVTHLSPCLLGRGGSGQTDRQTDRGRSDKRVLSRGLKGNKCPGPIMFLRSPRSSAKRSRKHFYQRASRIELPEDEHFSEIRILLILFLPHSNIRMYSNEVVQQDFTPETAVQGGQHTIKAEFTAAIVAVSRCFGIIKMSERC